MLTWLSFTRLRDSSRWLTMTRRWLTKQDQSAVASLSLTSRNMDRCRGGCDCPVQVMHTTIYRPGQRQVKTETATHVQI